MKGEVPAKGTSPFFLIIIKFGTFFTHSLIPQLFQ